MPLPTDLMEVPKTDGEIQMSEKNKAILLEGNAAIAEGNNE
jgi:hypothetical protein